MRCFQQYGYFLILLLGIFVNAAVFGQTTFLLEAELATLLGNATVVNCNSASSSQMVKNINTGGPAHAIEFQNIDIPEAGTYFITVSYIDISDPTIHYQLNGVVAQPISATASGLWCYQGGTPKDITFEDYLEAGTNTLLFYDSPIIDKIIIASDTARLADTFYVSSSTGDDRNDGKTPETAWQSLARINAIDLMPGDSLYFKKGDTFTGQLILRDESGSPEQPILISSFGSGEKPIIDGNGFLAAIHIQNSGYIHLSNLEIKNDGGPAQAGSPTNLRYGLYLENTFTDGTVFEHFRFSDLIFKNIYTTETITDDDQTGVHANGFRTSGSWGDDQNPTRFEDMLIENCLFTRTGRHALWVTATKQLTIRDNLFEQVGGAGMVIGANSSNILVERNTTNYTGSNIDPRMAARGSGLWCFMAKNLVAQHNTFLHARGIKDSYGMHIDIGNRNVVYQYNYSEDNEGGFVEVLGANVNVGYRYNLSVGDGWRSRGNQLGRIFWIGGWSGNPNQPIGSDSVFIYNNSIYVPNSIRPNIWIEAPTKRSRIYNNIVYAPNGLEQVFIKNNANLNDFDHNLWYGNIPSRDTDGDYFRGSHALTDDPLFTNSPVNNTDDFVLHKESPALNSGKLIYNPNAVEHFFSSHGGYDYFGNPVSTSGVPSIGAYDGQGITVGTHKINNTEFKLFPNPIWAGQPVLIRLPDEVNKKEVLLTLLDASGKIMLQKNYSGQAFIELDAGKYPVGAYLIKITANDYRKTQRLIILSKD